MDASECRTANIRIWVAEMGGPAKWLQKYGKGTTWTPAQVSQWISEAKPKGIGRPLARKIERQMNLPQAVMDYPPASQPVGPDAATMRSAAKFLEQLFVDRNKVFVVSDRIPMLMDVYGEMSLTDEPNMVALTTKYGAQLDGEDDERKKQAGSIGEDDRQGNRRRAGTA